MCLIVTKRDILCPKPIIDLVTSGPIVRLAHRSIVACTAGVPVRGEQKAAAGEGEGLKNLAMQAKVSRSAINLKIAIL